ncbi:MAG: cation diffusion facilitator family transporter, partial [Persephonella sp.]|nr:cation diffusion facilitator family transporter [Persephonella sp.]
YKFCILTWSYISHNYIQYWKVFEPVEVESVYVIVMGAVAFVINAFSAWLLGFHGHEHNDEKHEDLNIRAAYLHLLSDAGISLGVVIGGIVIYFYGLNWVDPLISILFSLYILKETIPVLKKSYMILMESVPAEIDVNRIKDIILENPEVCGVHDIHIWALSSKDIYLSAHLVLEKDVDIEKFDSIVIEIRKRLEAEGINHITLQPETKDFECEYTY